MTWNELKDFCNNLPKDKLSHDVVMWREEEGITDFDAIQLEEDHYIDENADEAGCMSEKEMYQGGVFIKVYDKGHPILLENF